MSTNNIPIIDREVNIIPERQRKLLRNLFTELSRINGKLNYDECIELLKRARYPMTKANKLLLETAYDDFAIDDYVTGYKVLLRITARWIIYKDENIRSMENESGEIPTPNLRSILTKLQAKDRTITNDLIDKMIDSVDPDEDGHITFKQFALMLVHRGEE